MPRSIVQRLLRRFRSDDVVVAEQLAEGHAPDATVDEVGTPPQNIGFEGRPIGRGMPSGHGTGDPTSGGWAGWAGGGGTGLGG